MTMIKLAVAEAPINKRTKQPGLSPGTPVFVGERKVDEVRIHVMDYDKQRLDEYFETSLEECARLKAFDSVTWINISGIHDVEMIIELGETFGLHPLTLEDIVNTTQRPKAEDFDDYIFMALKLLQYDTVNNTIETEHASLILGHGYVLTFLEDSQDMFDTVRERLRQGKGRMRGLGADYLCYALADAMVDHYFTALEQFGDYIEILDEAILDSPQAQHMQEIHRLKREAIRVRKAVWPLREEVSYLDKIDSPLITPQTRLFLRDLYDHIIQSIDMVEGYRDILGSLHDTCLSTVSNRMNEIMKVLTIIATIFIPLTFIVGVYGMNFANMPELRWGWGYFLVWGLMILIVLGMMIQFKRRGWW
ncbi:magnesium/cobalt transporter CorA [Marinobacterium sedimentorum]|uniref:magnesium/cobalt transporter CorA n=1 Tax=Marinobacterium sedimentorum TaxID=2927804 RepID=UPI0020C5E6C0|nr:magnesium/cobalt transporter CorA [Marinobacterium sedimentorum]MCP8687470.1 magnesium/cobalt transporter CorA [Marinobacterium sedimentorum]